MDYEELLKEGKSKLPEVSSKSDRFSIPNIRGHVQGNRTILTNFIQIAEILRREPEHLLKFILKELATPGEIKKTGAVIIGSKVSASRINDKILYYAEKYVICKECGRPDTKLLKEGDVVYMRCMACGSKKPV
jgi:translation initiation factor 2 subunit 2